MPIIENQGNTSLESNATPFAAIFIKSNGRVAKLEALSYAQSKSPPRAGIEIDSGWIPIGAETRDGKTTVAIKFTSIPDTYTSRIIYQAADYDPASGKLVGIHRVDGGYKTRQQIEAELRLGGQASDIDLFTFSESNEKDFLARFDWVVSPSSSPSQGQIVLDRPYDASNTTINSNSNNVTTPNSTTTIAPAIVNNNITNVSNNIANTNTTISNVNAPTYNVSNTYAKNLIGDVLTGSPQLSQNSFDAKFYNLGGGRYGVQQKGKTTIDEITGASTLKFGDQTLSVADDIAATFSQVKGVDDVSGVVFRLYNAAFARLPDANGLENWINGNKSGGQTYSSSALEFAKSQEFKNRYGSNVSDTQYITTLYNNVLGRDPDAAGLAHYQSLLSAGKDRGSLLLDFSESPENRTIFTKTTGLS